MAVDPGGAVGVGVVGLAGEHDRRLVPAARGHFAYGLAFDFLGEVFLAAEEHFDVFVEAAAAVVAGVDDYAVTLILFAEDVVIDGEVDFIVH